MISSGLIPRRGVLVSFGWVLSEGRENRFDVSSVCPEPRRSRNTEVGYEDTYGRCRVSTGGTESRRRSESRSETSREQGVERLRERSGGSVSWKTGETSGNRRVSTERIPPRLGPR